MDILNYPAVPCSAVVMRAVKYLLSVGWTLLQMLEDWIENKNPIAMNQAPTLREKSILLVKLMQYVEKRFPDDLELNAQFLDIVNYIYRFANIICPS
jgi:hypothetical protein